jgi:hypothetical protein
MLELLLIFPLFIMLFFGAYMMGDIMFIQSKSEVAARYGAWKRNGGGGGKADDYFFYDVAHRVGSKGRQIQVERDFAEADRFPERESQSSDSLLYRRINQAGVDGAAGGGASNIVSIVYDGNDLSGYRYFGATSSPRGGGWVVEQRALVTYSYRPMGLGFMPVMEMGAAALTLNGKVNGSMMEKQDHPGADGKFRFRDTEAVPGKDNRISGETAGILDHLQPPDPLRQ